jgi:FkbM family methyltransferase
MGIINNRRVGFIEQIKKIFDERVLRYLENRHKRHLKEGFPQLCISSFDHIGTRVNYFGRYESTLLNIAIEFLKKNFPEALKKTAIDAGANIGNHSVFFAQVFKKVYSFEPVLKTFDILKINIRGRYNVEAINKGLSDSHRSERIAVSPANQGSARIATNSDEFTETISLTTLDSFVEKNKIKVGLLKIDVEGHELSVLRGAKSFLNDQKPIVMFELLAEDVKNGNNSFEYLKSLGYTNFYEVKDGIVTYSKLKRLMYLFFGYEVGLVKFNSVESRTYNMILATF